MDRFTISLDTRLAAEFDALIRARGYGNRSEAVRDILREKLEAERLKRQEAPFCVATLSYIYNHHARELAERLTAAQHAHHDLIAATMHVHLDHDDCLETVMLRGATAAVRAFADAVVAERGVRHGSLHMVPVDVDTRHGPQHAHAVGGPAHHVHSHPKS